MPSFGRSQAGPPPVPPSQRAPPSEPWTIANTALIAAGEAEPFEFGAQLIEDFAYWLDDADWLDPYPNLAALDLTQRNHLFHLVNTLGDVGELDRFAIPGWPRPRGVLRLNPLLASLALLRRTWRIHKASNPTTSPQQPPSMRNPRAPGATDTGGSAPLDEIRSWIVANIMLFGFLPSFDLVLRGQDIGRHFAVGNRPTSPLMLVMLALGVGTGAVDGPGPTLHICDYPRVAESSRAIAPACAATTDFAVPAVASASTPRKTRTSNGPNSARRSPPSPNQLAGLTCSRTNRIHRT